MGERTLNDLIMKLIKGEPVTDDDIAQELYEICDRVHSGCDTSCPVFTANGGQTVGFDEDCLCFKQGKKMLKFLRGAVNK